MAASIIKEDRRQNGKCRLTQPIKNENTWLVYQFSGWNAGRQPLQRRHRWVGWASQSLRRLTASPHLLQMDIMCYRSFIIRMWDNSLFFYLTRQYLPKTADTPTKKENETDFSCRSDGSSLYSWSRRYFFYGLPFLAESLFYTGQKRKLICLNNCAAQFIMNRKRGVDPHILFNLINSLDLQRSVETARVSQVSSVYFLSVSSIGLYVCEICHDGLT